MINHYILTATLKLLGSASIGGGLLSGKGILCTKDSICSKRLSDTERWTLGSSPFTLILKSNKVKFLGFKTWGLFCVALKKTYHIEAPSIFSHIHQFSLPLLPVFMYNTHRCITCIQWKSRIMFLSMVYNLHRCITRTLNWSFSAKCIFYHKTPYKCVEHANNIGSSLIKPKYILHKLILMIVIVIVSINLNKIKLYFWWKFEFELFRLLKSVYYPRHCITRTRGFCM